MEKLTVLPETFLNSSVGKGMGALPVLFAILVFTDVLVPCKFCFAAKGKGALPVCLPILPFTDVFVSIGISDGKVSVWFAIPEFMFYACVSLVGAGCFGYSIERRTSGNEQAPGNG